MDQPVKRRPLSAVERTVERRVCKGNGLYPVLLAPLRVEDPKEDIHRKIRIVAAYTDILIARRIWNWKAFDHSTMQYTMFRIIQDIRGRSPAEVADILSTKRATDDITFASKPNFSLHGRNKRSIKLLLARMTDYVETHSGMPSNYEKLSGSDYEIEHIWANHYEWHEDEFAHPEDFRMYRNRIGGLLLLPKKDNTSYGDLPYVEKRKHYLKQNLLAQSLHEEAYEHNPGFSKFIEESGLPFKAHPEFKKADLDARQELYLLLAEKIWDPERLQQELAYKGP